MGKQSMNGLVVHTIVGKVQEIFKAFFFEDVAEGFGPLQSAYNAKDIGVLLQLAMAIPKIWQHLSTTRSLAFQLLTQNHMGLHHFQSEVDRQLFLFDEVQIEPGWETLWIELKPPPSYVDLRSLPLNSQSGQSACFEGSIQTLLEVHARRVHRILTAPSIGTAQAVWELMHEITRTSQSLVLFVMCPYLETVTGRSEADAKSERKTSGNATFPDCRATALPECMLRAVSHHFMVVDRVMAKIRIENSGIRRSWSGCWKHGPVLVGATAMVASVPS